MFWFCFFVFLPIVESIYFFILMDGSENSFASCINPTLAIEVLVYFRFYLWCLLKYISEGFLNTDDIFFPTSLFPLPKMLKRILQDILQKRNILAMSFDVAFARSSGNRTWCKIWSVWSLFVVSCEHFAVLPIPF